MIPAWVKQLPMKEIAKVAEKHGISLSLVAAIVMKESSGNPFAARFEPHYRWVWEVETCAKRLPCSHETEMIGQKTSYGLMQMMGSVAREWGFTGWFAELYGIEKNLQYGCKHLKQFLGQYPRVEDAVSAYNQGSPRRGTDGKYCNQSYVDAVMAYEAVLNGAHK